MATLILRAASGAFGAPWSPPPPPPHPPCSVAGLILRGICLMRQQELDWMYRGGGAAALRPGGKEGLVWVRAS